MRRSFRSALLLTLLLVAAWLLWSGIYKPLLLWLGVISCLLSVYLAYRVGFFDRPTGLHVLPRLPRYWLWLLGEIARSSVEVCRIVLSPRLPIAPRVVELTAEPKGPVGQVILSNAITLAPGTVTLDLHDGKLLVHCLTQGSADALTSGPGNRLSAELTTG